ncbi:hypothetical protein [Paenibacillus taichungensis]|nr:hypothetical protein [Paenibacillus taichungensis]MDR9749691.1 hypothetical protein [Paenibacillus taichungensis]
MVKNNLWPPVLPYAAIPALKADTGNIRHLTRQHLASKPCEPPED